MGLTETPMPIRKLTTYNDKDGRYFKVSFRYMGGVIRETKIFQSRKNLERWLYLNNSLVTGLKGWLIEEEEG